MKPSEGILIGCPNCQIELSIYYGHLQGNKSRYFCLLCENLYPPELEKKIQPGPPLCPDCGKSMVNHQNSKGQKRFRCSDYPSCRKIVNLEARAPQNSSLPKKATDKSKHVVVIKTS
jgi:tRNA(Ile2) C34 agmatinyltransferase TiaS